MLDVQTYCSKSCACPTLADLLRVACIPGDAAAVVEAAEKAVARRFAS